jgi:SulP family sulfate permease
MRVLVLDASSVTELDSSADTALVEIADDLASRGIQLYLAGVKGRLLDVMRRSGSYQALGPENIFLSDDDAVRRAAADMDVDPDIDLAETDEMLIEESPGAPT